MNEPTNTPVSFIANLNTLYKASTTPTDEERNIVISVGREAMQFYAEEGNKGISFLKLKKYILGSSKLREVRTSAFENAFNLLTQTLIQQSVPCKYVDLLGDNYFYWDDSE
mgnify:CR=1 FL=1